MRVAVSRASEALSCHSNLTLIVIVVFHWDAKGMCTCYFITSYRGLSHVCSWNRGCYEPGALYYVHMQRNCSGVAFELQDYDSFRDIYPRARPHLVSVIC